MKLHINKSFYANIVNILHIICQIISIILFIHKTQFQHDNKRSLAFLSYNVTQTSLQNYQIQSQKILITGLDNYKLRQYIINLLNIDTQTSTHLSSKDLKVWVRELKLSGFFHSVKVKCSLNAGNQLVFIYLKPNNILKQIKILNLDQKLISTCYVQKIFRNDLGLPINFSRIEQQIQLIKEWYWRRGYKKVTINFQYNSINKNSIEIEIDEYLLNKINIVILQTSYSCSSLQNIHLNYWLKKILSTNLDEPLNIIDLEIYLKELQQQNIVQQSYYEIREDKVRELFLYLQPLNRRSTYVFSQKRIITKSFLEYLEFLCNYSLSGSILDKDFSMLVISKIHQYYTQFINYINLDNALYYKMCQYDFIFYQSLSIFSSLLQNSLHNHSYIQNSTFVLNNNFGFRHFIRYLDKYNSSISLNLIFPNVRPVSHCKYYIPYIKSFQSLTTSLMIHIFNNSSFYKKHSRYSSMNYNHNTFIYPNNSLIQQNNILFQIQHNLSGNKRLYNDLIRKKVTYNSWLFKSNIRFDKLYNYFTNASYLGSFIGYQLHNLYAFTKYKLGFTVPLSKNDISVINNDCYNFEITSLVSKTKMNHNWGSIIHKITHDLRYKVNFHNQTLMFYIRLLYLIGDSKYLPFLEKFVSVGPDTIRGYIKEFSMLPNLSKNYKLEYYIYKTKRKVLYIFVDYFFKQYKSQQIGNSMHFIRDKNNIDISLKLSYGIGLQIMTPIKQIPPLHIEYGYNMSHGQCLHLRIQQEN
uniref:Conserved_ORF_4 protein n=1 Tax=Titanophycus setchellii TaxID=940129 RepID=A0A1G4NY41_9FLOR|nr:hypothetical protein P8471_pgp131 [Titanophycus setchellii]SCW23578.1 conserved_ORF_4 [Titanophycus setchellii]